MKKRILIPLTCLVFAAALPIHAEQQQDRFWQTPTIQNYGKIHYLPESAFKPKANQQYKVVFTIKKGASHPEQINPALDHVARTVNLYVASGVPLKNLHFVVIAYADATSLVLNDNEYRKQFGIANPNLPLITELKNAGITISICGQAMAEHHFPYDSIAPHVTLALSALTTITVLEHQGYSLLML